MDEELRLELCRQADEMLIEIARSNAGRGPLHDWSRTVSELLKNDDEVNELVVNLWNRLFDLAEIQNSV